MTKGKPRKPASDPNVAAYEAVARLTGRDIEKVEEKAINREKKAESKRGKGKKTGEQRG